MKTTLIIILSLILSSCHDTVNFENVRKLKTGMSITKIEGYMGEPLSYTRISDSSEMRTYIYDSPFNGYDKYIDIEYVNEKAKNIK